MFLHRWEDVQVGVTIFLPATMLPFTEFGCPYLSASTKSPSRRAGTLFMGFTFRNSGFRCSPGRWTAEDTQVGSLPGYSLLIRSSPLLTLGQSHSLQLKGDGILLGKNVDGTARGRVQVQKQLQHHGSFSLVSTQWLQDGSRSSPFPESSFLPTGQVSCQTETSPGSVTWTLVGRVLTQDLPFCRISQDSGPSFSFSLGLPLAFTTPDSFSFINHPDSFFPLLFHIQLHLGTWGVQSSDAGG